MPKLRSQSLGRRDEEPAEDVTYWGSARKPYVTKAQREVLASALARVLPLRDPAGVVYGYVVRNIVGQLPLGPYTNPNDAHNAAIEVEHKVRRAR